MKRRIFSVMMALALCLSLLPGTAWAADEDEPVTPTAETGEPEMGEDGAIVVDGKTWMGGGDISDCRDLALPDGKSVSEAIEDLHLTEEGTVKVMTDEGEEFEDSNDGTAVIDTPLDVTDVSTPSRGAGYTWDAEHNILTLDNVVINDTVTIPDDTVTINVTGDCSIKELIVNQEPQKTKLTVSGTGKLTVKEKINMVGGNGNSLTVDAYLEVQGGIGIGASGSTDSTVTVNGTLIANGGDWFALNAGRVIVSSTGTLEVSGNFGVFANGAALEETANGGNSAFADAFCLEEGGVFRADCEEKIISIKVSYEFLQDQMPGNAADEGTWLNDNIQEIIKTVVNILPDYLPDGVEVMGTLKEEGNGGSWTAEVYIAGGNITVSKDNVKYSITVNSGEHGTISGSASPASARAGTQVSLTDITTAPNAGYRFTGWTSSDVTITDGTFTMPEKNVTITASWELISYSITVDSGIGGTASASPTSAAEGETITLTATPNEGYRFINWTSMDGIREPLI